MHSARSHLCDCLSRFDSATEDNSASWAILASTTVSCRVRPQPRWISRIRSRFSGDSSLRSPCSAPLVAARSRQLLGRNAVSNRQSSCMPGAPFCPIAPFCTYTPRHVTPVVTDGELRYASGFARSEMAVIMTQVHRSALEAALHNQLGNVANAPTNELGDPATVLWNRAI